MVRVTDVGRRTSGQAIVPLRRIREDALPENLEYADEGCELASRCLTCPLPRCKHDEPGGARRLLMEARDRQIIALRQTGRMTISALARTFGLSRRSVFRILQQARQAQGGGDAA